MIVSIAIIAYNEETTITSLFNDINNQTYPKENIEILLIDSMSIDGTRSVMHKFANEADEYKRIAIFENPGKWQSCGCNIALDNYTGDVFIRIDAHASIPEDFIAKNVENLKNGEKVSGGPRPNIIDGSTPWKKTLLMAESSMFGSSIASYRRSTTKSYVDSLFHGAYMREVFDKVGKYNERLWRTEDNEMSYRIRKAGYKMCFDPNIISYQHSRSTLFAMLRQKFMNGQWVALTLAVCPPCLSIFHFVPLCFVIAIIATSIIGCFGIFLPLIILLGSYLAADLLMTIMATIQNGFNLVYLTLPFLFFLLHLSYGIGSLLGIIKLPFKAKWLRGGK